MPMLEVTIRERICVPEGCAIEIAPTGAHAGIRMPDGTLVKPWAAYEHHHEGQEERDLGTRELTDMGIEPGLDFERTIEIV